ncbi:adenylosuccinate synthase, partial [Vibrio anguillarum]
KWLKKPHGQNGPGCHVAVSEFPTGYTGEIPDAIGFRAHTEYLSGSVVCEVKVSRGDFLADAKKPHRNGEVLGVGQHRFYFAPQGLIKPDELPEGWGLVEVNHRGGTKCIVGYTSMLNYGDRGELFEKTLFDADIEREMNILIRLCSRI